MAAGGTAQASTASLGIEQTILLGAMIANDLQTRQKQKHCPPKTDPSNQPTIGMAKKPDIKFIDYLQKKHNLSDSLRERLHEEITGQNLSKTEIEAIVKSLVEELPKRLPPIE
jgi:hypothetical protein